MSDAPRWPGADGSPGLDFSPKPKEGNQNPAAGASSASKPDASTNDDATRKVKLPRDPASQPASPASANRKSQNADDWQLDSITRPPKPQSGPSAPSQPNTLSSSTTAAEPVAPPAAKPSRAANAAEEPTGRPTRTAASRHTRKARLRITRIDPWSVMKTSFLFSIAFGVMLVAGVAVLWSVVAGSDALNYINDLINSVIGDPRQGAPDRFNIHEFLGWRRVIGLSAVLAAIDVVIFTAVATLFAFLYNLASVIMGGLEITLAED